MSASEVIKWVIVAMFALGGLATVSQVGKPRRPLTGGTAAWVVAFNTVYIVLILVFWGRS